jgi:hypothetical protein
MIFSSFSRSIAPNKALLIKNAQGGQRIATGSVLGGDRSSHPADHGAKAAGGTSDTLSSVLDENGEQANFASANAHSRDQSAPAGCRRCRRKGACISTFTR